MVIIGVGIVIMIWQAIKRPAFFRGETLAMDAPAQRPPGAADCLQTNRRTQMSDYAVVNPATGETLATYDTITDDAARQQDRELRMPPSATGASRPSPSGPHCCAASPNCIANAATSSPRSIVREMGKPLAAALGEVDFAADITEFYADNVDKITGDQPLRHPGRGHRA